MNKKNYGVLSNEQADYLIKLPKKILCNENILDVHNIDQSFPFIQNLILVSPEDNDVIFLWEIIQSKKVSIRINLHFQDNDSKIGLLRVDFNSGHRNPENITNLVPEKFHPYKGKYFSNDEHHIHYHVEGYKSLAWAIPLADDEFEINTLSTDNFNDDFIKAILLFAKTINLETILTINPLLI